MEFATIIMAKSIFFQRLLDGIFHFNSTICKQTEETLIRRRPVASDLGLHRLPVSQ